MKNLTSAPARAKPGANGAARASGNGHSLPGLPGSVVPTLPGTGPHDGEVPRAWWWLDNDFLATLELPQVRGIAAQPVFSERDQKTLQNALYVIREARQALQSGVPEQALEGRFKLVNVVAYLTGLLDGKRVPGASAGIVALAAAQGTASDLDSLLVALEARLDALTQRTRAPVSGGALVGIGSLLVAAGAALKALADHVD